MLINAITSRFQTQQPTVKNNFNNGAAIIKPNNHYLAKDTVSFTASPMQKSGELIKEALSMSYKRRLPDYNVAGTKLKDTLSAIAEKFKGYGVTFDRAYCDKATVKSEDSFFSKFIRSGEPPLDKVRSTLFVENLYDLKFINDKILPEFERRGYKILQSPDKTLGRKVLSKKPDFAVRLNGITEKDAKNLDPELRGGIGHGQKSGYEDIQLRLIDTTVAKSKQEPLEVLLIFGKNYANAKHDESKYVYNIIRALSGVLHISQVKEPAVHSPAARVLNNIGIISEMLRGNISKPLFINAKNKDFYHDNFELPIELSSTSCKTLTGLLQGIRTKIPEHYREQVALVKSVDYDKEIVKKIKASPDYKERADKTVFAEDVKNARKEILAQLRTQKAEDLKLICEVQEEMAKTIEKYGVKENAKPKV